jgi:ATP-dependent helicase/DNAse subunit B
LDIAPYWLRGATPCPNCDYKSICRFQPGLNRYTHVPSLGKDEVLNLVAGKGAS